MGSYVSSEQPSNIDENEAATNQQFSPHRMEVQPQSLDLAKKIRKPQVTILNEILKEKIKLNEKLVKENNAILKEFLETFIPEMRRRDKLFDSLFQKIYYTGSYYSDLRISTPDEYDLNLVLKPPFKSNTISVVYHPQVPSYAKYSTTDKSCESKEIGLDRIFKDGYLIPNEVRVWLQSVVDKTLSTYKTYPRNVINIKTSGSGPARTIILVKKCGVIDIDLVPAIECSMNLKPPGINGKVYEKVKDNLQCFLVPKPYQTNKQAPINKVECARLWRTHYPEAEGNLIHDCGCVKPVIKLLKLLRDKENWKILASYYLKTVIMWMIIDNPSLDYWKPDRIGERFMEALSILARNVKERKICYFFSSRHNLLEKMNDAQANNIHNRLCAIIKEVERDPRNLWKIFDCPPTFSF